MDQQIAKANDQEQSFRKGREIILAKSKGGLELVDFKILNCLMYRALPAMKVRNLHRMPVRDVLRFLNHTSTDRLQESLKRLGNANIEIDYKDDEGTEHHAVVHYLSFDLTRTENGEVVYAFDPLLVSMLSDPAIYGTLNINMFQRFKSVYTLKLYEVLSLYVKRRIPVWDVSLDELRDVLQVADSYAERPDNFRARVIEASVKELNEVSDFHVEIEYVRGGRGGRIQRVKFHTRYRQPEEILAISRQVGDPIGRGKSQRDAGTVDMLDGRTDTERGDTTALLPETLELARDYMLEGDDLDALEGEWRLDIRGRRVSNPDESFIQWLSVRKDQKSNADLEIVDPDFLADLVGRFQ